VQAFVDGTGLATGTERRGGGGGGGGQTVLARLATGLTVHCRAGRFAATIEGRDRGQPDRAGRIQGSETVRGCSTRYLCSRESPEPRQGMDTDK